MAGHETRMLLLGAVALFEPVNGYQIRRELLSWQVEAWANVNPGSIYNGLATLTRQGHLVRHDLLDAGREVAVYEMTDAGRDPFCGVGVGPARVWLGWWAVSWQPSSRRDRFPAHRRLGVSWVGGGPVPVSGAGTVA